MKLPLPQMPEWLKSLSDSIAIKLGFKMPEPFEKKSVLIIGLVSLILFSSTVFTTYQFLKHGKLIGSGQKSGQNLENNAENLPTVADINEDTPATIEPIEDHEAKKPEENSKELTFLLLGYGGAGHSGGMLSDVLQLVHMDFEKQKIYFISVPRDLLVELPSGQTYKINTAFTVGGGPNPLLSGGKIAKQMAQTVSGLGVDYFLAVDFVGFERLIGYELRNIDVNVTEPLDDPWYPIRGLEQETCGKSPEEIAELTAKYSGFELEKQFTCRYEHVQIGKGKHLMDGGTALKFVRSRHGTGAGDFSRSLRQHDLLKGIKDKLISLEALKSAPEFFKKFTKHVATDIDLEIMQALLPFMSNAQAFEIKTLTLSTDNVFKAGKSASGQYVLLPKAGNNDFSEVQEYLKSQLN